MIYLDNAATTEPKIFSKDYNYWFNSNTPYVKEETKLLKQARQDIKDYLGTNKGYVIVGSCSSGLVQDLFQKINENS